MTVRSFLKNTSGSNRKTLALSLLVVCAAVMALTGYGAMASSHGSARRAAADLAECQAIAGELAELRHRPSVAGSAELQEGEIVSLIERASQAANMTRDQVARIWPENARRLGQSPYKEKSTQVHLRRMTLRQAVTFLHTLCSGQSGLRVQSLRFVAPREQEARELWSVEATLSYLIFAPSNAKGTRP